jgi:hypothetical protein
VSVPSPAAAARTPDITLNLSFVFCHAGGAEFEASDRAKEDAEAELTLVPEDLDRCIRGGGLHNVGVCKGACVWLQVLAGLLPGSAFAGRAVASTLYDCMVQHVAQHDVVLVVLNSLSSSLSCGSAAVTS